MLPSSTKVFSMEERDGVHNFNIFNPRTRNFLPAKVSGYVYGKSHTRLPLAFSFFLLPMILSSPLKAPEDTNKMFVVSTATISPLTFLDLSETTPSGIKKIQ